LSSSIVFLFKTKNQRKWEQGRPNYNCKRHFIHLTTTHTYTFVLDFFKRVVSCWHRFRWITLIALSITSFMEQLHVCQLQIGDVNVPFCIFFISIGLNMFFLTRVKYVFSPYKIISFYVWSLQNIFTFSPCLYFIGIILED
jgi:hypothetical protein